MYSTVPLEFLHFSAPVSPPIHMQGRKRKGEETPSEGERKKSKQITELPWVDESDECKADRMKWARKPLKPLEPSEDTISVFILLPFVLTKKVFQQMDALYHVEKGESSFAAQIRNKEPSYPVIKMYGITAEGHSVMVHIHGGTHSLRLDCFLSYLSYALHLCSCPFDQARGRNYSS